MNDLRVLIRTPNHVGDCVMSLAALARLRARSPNCHITLVAPAYVAELYEATRVADDIVALRSYHGVAGARALYSAVRARGSFEIAMTFTDSLGAVAALRSVGVRRVFGYGANGRSLLLTRALDTSARKNRHRALSYCDLCDSALESSERATIESLRLPGLTFSDADRSSISEIAQERGLRSTTSWVALAPQAVAPSRRWGFANYGRLCQRIVAELGLEVGLIGSTNEAPAAVEVIRLSGCKTGVTNFCGAFGLRDSLILLSSVGVFVGNDSGSAHLAALAGASLVVLSGPDNPLETSPLSDDKSIIYRRELPCISCVRNRCPLTGPSHMLCMRSISVEEVFETLRFRLRPS